MENNNNINIESILTNIDNRMDEQSKKIDNWYRSMKLDYEFLRYQLDQNYNIMSSLLEILDDDLFFKK